MRLPLPAGEFKETLGETDFIRPSDERIAAVAREIVGTETSALAATRAICRWVSEYIEGAMIAETLSGPEVLERRTGKCTEYTTLFASLARAAGVPTRVALGQRRFNGSWGGHMWNEVYVGEWIPVDASANEVGGSLNLLKFVHSDSVMGTQPLRWKLTESLSVAIEDFESEPRAAGATAGLETGLRDDVYCNVDYGFRFRLPSEQWRIDDGGDAGPLLVRLRPPDDALGDSMMIHLVAFGIGAGMPPKALTNARLNHHRTMLRDFELLQDEAVRVGGADGHRTRFRGVPHHDDAVPTHVTEVLWIQGETGCLLNLIATDERHEEYLARFEGILSTFEFLEE